MHHYPNIDIPNAAMPHAACRISMIYNIPNETVLLRHCVTVLCISEVETSYLI